MSDICAIFRLDDGPVGSDDVRRLLGADDGAGVWAGGSPPAPAGLGGRVTAFTPEDEFDVQPVCSRDGQVVLVADARVDNRADLGRALGIDCATLARTPDSALILASYEAWGEDCARRVLGDFAFILWDGRRRALIAARDAMGQRVLFYRAAPARLVLATDIRALFRQGPVRLDEQKLADFLVLLQDPESTFFEDVRRVPAGHVLVGEGGRFRLRRYWAPEPARVLRLPSDEAYVEAFREVFATAVRARLRSAGGVGVMMSAGLDSTSVAAVAAAELAVQGKGLAAYHAAPRAGFTGPVRPGWIADESGHVRTLAAQYGNIDLWVHRPDGRSPLDCMDGLFGAVGGPIRNPNNLAWLEAIYARAGADGVRALLVGHKGNMTISYTGLRSLRDLARRGHWPHVLREIRAFARQNGRDPAQVLKNEILIPLFPRLLYRAWSWLRGNRAGPPVWEATHSAILPAFAAEMRVDERLRTANQAAVGMENAGGDEYRRATLTSAADGPDFNQGYRSRFGVETRDPTCDLRVIDFCLSIPPSQYLRNGQSRWLIRRSMRGRVDPGILDRATRGAQAADWVEWLPPMRGGLRADLDRLERSALARRCLDLARLRGLLDAWPERLGLEHYTEYNLMLLRGMELGRFILWFEGDGAEGGP